MRYFISLWILVSSLAYGAAVGDRKEDNPNQDKDIVIQVNRGGTVNTTIMTIKGASGGSDVSLGSSYTLQVDSLISSTGTSPSGLTPVGAIVPYTGTTVPAGWLMCDGTSYLRSSYPALAAILNCSSGTCAFGQADSTHFYVDLRGLFLRGTDSGAGLDWSVASRSSLNGGNSGANVGSYEEQGTTTSGWSVSNSLGINNSGVGQHRHVSPFALRGSWVVTTNAYYSGGSCWGVDNASHSNFLDSGCPYVYASAAYDFAGFSTCSSVFDSTATSTDIFKTSSADDTTTINSTLSGSVSFTGGDSESRPPNLDVNYIIKY